MQRQLARIGHGQSRSVRAPAKAATLKPGTRLLRLWQGTSHEVTVLGHGFAWQGTTYGSLSEIARAITGARWSGPRFFGLKELPQDRGTP